MNHVLPRQDPKAAPDRPAGTDHVSPLARNLLDFVGLQASWFACVLGAGAGHFWLGPAVVAVALPAHFAASPDRWRDARTMLFVATLGVATDLAQVGLGVVSFPGDAPRLGPLPIWLLVLWPILGANFHSTLAWLQRRPGLAVLLGALGGPPGYLAAERFSALELGRPLGLSLLMLAVAWGLLFGLGVLMARRQARPRTEPGASTSARRPGAGPTASAGPSDRRRPARSC